jgi:hypothetical protein
MAQYDYTVHILIYMCFSMAFLNDSTVYIFVRFSICFSCRFENLKSGERLLRYGKVFLGWGKVSV